MIYILSIILFFMGLYLCSIKDKSFNNCELKLRKKILKFLSDEKYNGYFINIIIAILGVTCAILLTNYDTKKQEINQTIDLLNHLSHELIIGEEKINENIHDITMDYEDELTAEVIKCIQFAPSVTMENLLTVSPYPSTISGICYNALHECKKNVDILQNAINKTNKLEDIEGILTIMLYELEYMNGVVNLEVMYQNGKINYDELYNSVNELYVNVFNKDDIYGFYSDKYFIEFVPIE